MERTSFLADLSLAWLKPSRQMLLLSLLVVVVALAASSPAPRGQNVCSRTVYSARPIHIRQSYRRPVRHADLALCRAMNEVLCNRTRISYRTVYRTTVKMGLTTKLVSGCCSGWKKRAPNDTDCLEPQCQFDCQNGGSCVGPNMCLCREGYIGQYCEKDIDECAGRNPCQHKCANLVGSFSCSCSEGFTLANDNTSCDLCLNCTSEFRALQDKVSSLPEPVAEVNVAEMQADMMAEMKRQTESFEKLQDQYDTIVGIQKQIDVLPEMTARIQNLSLLSTEVDKLKNLQDEVLDVKQHMNQGFAEIKSSFTSLSLSAKQDAEAWERKALNASAEQAEVFAALYQKVESMAARIDSLEQEKEALKTQVASAEATVSALKVKQEAMTTQEPMTSTEPADPVYGGDHIPMRLVALESQTSLLEEKISGCNCGQNDNNYPYFK